MDLARVDLPPALALTGWMLALPLLAIALARADWRQLSKSALAQVWPAAIVVLAVLWSIRATTAAGVAFHLSGMAALALATGPWPALAGGALVSAVSALVFGAPSSGVAVAWLAGVALPVGVSTAVRAIARARLPPHFFVYVFVVAFFGSAAAFVATGVAGAALLVAALDTEPSVAWGEYAVVVAALAFGEALLTGMSITLGAVYRPDWVVTFDPDRDFTG